MRERVMALAGSTVVVGDDRTVRVHAHAEDPGPLLSMGVSYGALDQVSIQNMDDQHQQFMERHGYTPGVQVDLAVVAVAPGEGIERVFVDLGAARIVRGGQTMNPSAADLLDAIRMANATHTVVLPNNSNIVLAANQAATGGRWPTATTPFPWSRPRQTISPQWISLPSLLAPMRRSP